MGFRNKKIEHQVPYKQLEGKQQQEKLRSIVFTYRVASIRLRIRSILMSSQPVCKWWHPGAHHSTAVKETVESIKQHVMTSVISRKRRSRHVVAVSDPPNTGGKPIKRHPRQLWGGVILPLKGLSIPACVLTRPTVSASRTVHRDTP